MQAKTLRSVTAAATYTFVYALRYKVPINLLSPAMLSSCAPDIHDTNLLENLSKWMCLIRWIFLNV